MLLDYVGVPFKCIRCDHHGHEMAESDLSFKRDMAQDLDMATSFEMACQVDDQLGGGLLEVMEWL